MSYGQHFGKDDYERYGIFAEMMYLHGKGYTGSTPVSDVRDLKGRQMFPGGPKWKVGLQDCYFDKKFKRLFIGEGLPRKEKPKEKEKKEATVPVFRPSSNTHLHSTPGDTYGCFTRKIKAFDPRAKKIEESKKKKDQVTEIKFIPTNPGKKGGCGYTNNTINRYPKYIPTAYEPKEKVEGEKGKKGKEAKEPIWKPAAPGGYFDPKPNRTRNRSQWVTYISTYPASYTLGGATFLPSSPTKWLGGCMGGCFSKWPKYIPTRYVDPWKFEKYQEELEEKRKSAKGKGGAPAKKEDTKVAKMLPPSRNKTYPMKSVMESKAYIGTNNVTWRTMQPITYTREFL